MSANKCDGGDRENISGLEVESHQTLGGLVSDELTRTNSQHMGEGDFRKLLTNKRRLMVEMKQLFDKLRGAKISDSNSLMCKLDEIKTLCEEFKNMTRGFSEPVEIAELVNEIDNQYERCSNLIDKMVVNLFGNADENDEGEVEPTDSVSQVGTETDSWATVPSRGSSASVRQIELKRKRAELAAMRDLEQAKAKAAQANAEAEARFRIEQAKLDAEEELVTLSERGSLISGVSRRTIKSTFLTKHRRQPHVENNSPNFKMTSR